MKQNIRTFISFPFSLIISAILLKMCIFGLSDLNDIFFDWITFFFKYIFTGIIVGFTFSFSYLLLAEDKIQNENVKKQISIFKYIFDAFYGLLFVVSIITVFTYGFLRDYSLINSKLLSYNENYFKYISVGIIIGIYGHKKKWFLRTNFF